MRFESGSAIYQWENKKIKKLPRLENFDFHARLYGIHVEELYVMSDAGFELLEERK